jgi:hypothetical protein
MRLRKTSRALVASPAALALAIALCASLVPAAVVRAADVETGPNFARPADLTADANGRLDKALAAYKAVTSAKTGHTQLLGVAIREFKRAKDAAPKFAVPCYYLGILYQWTEDFEKARQVLQAACDLNPKFHEAIVELGDVYMWLRDYDKALEVYDRAVAARPDYAHAYVTRGMLHLKRGSFKKGHDDLEAAKKLMSAEKYAGDAQGDKGLVEHYIELAKAELEPMPWPKTFTCETEHYRVRTPVSQEFADEVGRHAELIYKTYTQIFPKIEKGDRKFPVVVYGSKEDYHANGGPPSAGGHYDTVLRKLVFFRYPPKDGAPDELITPDTTLVLYHEGFHQFIADYLERPPQWFNEGLGDFFGPSRYFEPKGKSGKPKGKPGMQLVPNTWRLKYIQQCIQMNRIRAWRDLMTMTQQEMYDPEWAGIHYAQAWSIIYFLIRGGAPPGAQAGPYFKILGDYFKALRKGDGLEEAFNAAFGKQDVKRLEGEWKKFVVGLEEQP